MRSFWPAGEPAQIDYESLAPLWWALRDCPLTSPRRAFYSRTGRAGRLAGLRAGLLGAPCDWQGPELEGRLDPVRVALAEGYGLVLSRSRMDCQENRGRFSMRIGIYARVSTEAQEAKGTVASQLAALRERALAEGDEVIEEFCDDGYSGARLDRPALDALRDAAAAGAIEGLWCLSPDRLARVYALQVVILDELAPAACSSDSSTRPTSTIPRPGCSPRSRAWSASTNEPRSPSATGGASSTEHGSARCSAGRSPTAIGECHGQQNVGRIS